MTVGRAYLWLRAWSLFAHRAMAHLQSLDPRTDQEALERWNRRFYRAMDRQWTAYRRLQALCPPNPRPLP